MYMKSTLLWRASASVKSTTTSHASSWRQLTKMALLCSTGVSGPAARFRCLKHATPALLGRLPRGTSTVLALALWAHSIVSTHQGRQRQCALAFFHSSPWWGTLARSLPWASAQRRTSSSRHPLTDLSASGMSALGGSLPSSWMSAPYQPPSSSPSIRAPSWPPAPTPWRPPLDSPSAGPAPASAQASASSMPKQVGFCRCCPSRARSARCTLTTPGAFCCRLRGVAALTSWRWNSPRGSARCATGFRQVWPPAD
mmetsp:Transcript_99144/g.319662  ORF Transcript_99144/g.319662 Transcript_99144/m.319662 type:complete len:255 (-) Transcript_99144:474-1238(-)